MSHLISREGLKPERLVLEETLFHTANGYLGVRAAFEEGYPEGVPSVRGTYINAFYDTHQIRHPEKLFAFPETGEKIVAVTDAQGIELFADGERMVLVPDRVESFARHLDMDAGIATRSFTWKTERGKRLALHVRRLCSLARPELFAVQYGIEALDAGVQLLLASRLEGNVANHYDESDPRVSASVFKPLRVLAAEARIVEDRGEIFVESVTRNTGFHLAVLGMVEAPGAEGWQASASATGGEILLRRSLRAREQLVLVRKTVYADSIRHPDPAAAARRLAAAVLPLPFELLAREQADRLRSYWEAAEVTVEGDPSAAEGLRFGLFQLLQSAPRDGRSNIPAKGLSGEGYEGHYFWDTEIYMAPFFIYTNPALARDLLVYRHSILDGARRHARDMGQIRGAAYPWRTIAGRECSAYYPSGSAQYHINADIAYAYWRYFEATGDIDFMARIGAEVLFETARTWLEIGHFASGQFRIESVTGPDEYTCLVDNNYYTNAMARFHLSKAVEVRALLREREPRALAELESRISLGEEEVESWARAARSMYLPHDAARDLTPQDDGFLKKAPWDLAATPASGHPLLLHYHHLAIIRRQVCKQADAVLAHFLLPEIAAASTVKNSYLYYERITTHDSSLSYAVFSAMAARLGDVEKAHRYFNETVRLDLDDVQGNAKDGIHAANMGGAWLALVFGFGGFRPLGDAIAVDPVLPAAWSGISFRIAYRGRSLRVAARRAPDGRVATTVELVAGGPLEVERAGRRLLLLSAAPLDWLA
jgi:alpha,alpha-trehalose phosphorylase